MRSLTAAVLLAAGAAFAVEGAASAELTVGRQVALNATVELSPWLDHLWLVAGYGFLKSPDLAATDTTPRVPTAVSHLFSGGLDLSPVRQLTFSVLAQGSPRAGERVPLNLADTVALTTTRQSAGGTAMLIFDSGGDSAFEFSIDAGAGFTWNQLTRTLNVGPLTRIRSEPLFVTRPTVGLSAILKEATTVSVRAGYAFYSADPLQVGRLTDADLAALEQAVGAAAQRVSTDVELSQAALETALARLTAFDAVSGYPYAPVRFDLRAAVSHRFGERFTGQASWSYLRYVPGQGFGNVLGLKGTVKFSSRWRAWVSGSLQLDQTVDFPKTNPGARVLASGNVGAGAELSF